MTDRWTSYFCNVNGSLASIYVNLGLMPHVPIPSKPWLLWTWIYFQSPRSDGLSDGEEAPTLFEIEDALIQHLSCSCHAALCGRITTQGRREFYFYAETKKGFEKAVADALNSYPKYKFATGEQEDSLGKQYLDVLYPSQENLQRIMNRDVLDLLSEKGDIHTVARDVEHWIYFPSKEARELFKPAAIAAGFILVSDQQSNADLPFGISVVRNQSIEQNQIDSTVIELLQLVLLYGGEYDGWETQLMSQQSAE